MRFEDWANAQAKARGVSKLKILEGVCTASGVTLATLKGAARGMKLGNYQKAKAVSLATNGDVTITELCE